MNSSGSASRSHVREEEGRRSLFPGTFGMEDWSVMGSTHAARGTYNPANVSAVFELSSKA